MTSHQDPAMTLVRVQLELLELMSEVSTVVRRQEILRRHRVSTVLDVGANRGQYVKEIRSAGYDGRVISFEPLPDAFADLQMQCADDPTWTAVNVALGDRNRDTSMGVARNSVSSSVLPTLDSYVEANPEARYTNEVPVVMRRLDDEVATALGGGTLALKLDVQGYEDAVLRGAAEVLDQCCVVETELSLRPLYKNQVLAGEMVRQLNDAGFYLSSVERGFTNPITGQLMQVDGIFARHRCAHSAEV